MDLLLGAPLPTLDRVFRIARKTEEFGFDGFWLPDHILMVPQGFMPDVWGLLSAIAVKTERMDLGTGVTCPHRRHPAVLAQSSATLDELSEGRFILGIGAGESMNLDPFGIEWDRPVTRMVESIEVVRKLWKQEKVDYEGKFFKMKGAFLQMEPRRIPIYVGANGPTTRRITGKMGDGWVPITESPATYEKHLKDVRRGAKEEGRSPSEIDMALQVYTGITDDEKERTRLRMYPTSQLAMDSRKLEAAGYDVELPEGISPGHYFEELLPGEETSPKLLEMVEHIPPEAADEFSIFGDKDECVDKIERYIEAGVERFCFINVGPDPKEVLRIYGEEIIPYFKE